MGVSQRPHSGLRVVTATDIRTHAYLKHDSFPRHMRPFLLEAVTARLTPVTVSTVSFTDQRELFTLPAPGRGQGDGEDSF